MSGVSLPVNRPNGRALVVGHASARGSSGEILRHLGYQTQDADDPYSALAELCRRPLAYRAIILSLQALYREELQAIRTITRLYPHLQIWVTHTDGRAAALAEASRLGAHGLLSEDGLHRFATTDAAEATGGRQGAAALRAMAPSADLPELSRQEKSFLDSPAGEPVLTADELRALLQEQPARPAGDQP